MSATDAERLRLLHASPAEHSSALNSRPKAEVVIERYEGPTSPGHDSSAPPPTSTKCHPKLKRTARERKEKYLECLRRTPGLTLATRKRLEERARQTYRQYVYGTSEVQKLF